MLPSICSLLCVCAIFRINHLAKTISLLASRMPVRLEFFLQFSFSNIVFMFLFHYTCSVLYSRNSRNVWICYCTEINIVIYVLYTNCGPRGVPGVGNCLFLRARGWGIDRQVRTKLEIPWGMSGRGMVTGRIEPCISTFLSFTLHKRELWAMRMPPRIIFASRENRCGGKK